MKNIEKIDPSFKNNRFTEKDIPLILGVLFAEINKVIDKLNQLIDKVNQLEEENEKYQRLCLYTRAS